MTDVLLEKVLDIAPINWVAAPLEKDGEHRQNYIQALRSADNNDYRQLIEFVSN